MGSRILVAVVLMRIVYLFFSVSDGPILALTIKLLNLSMGVSA